jgi:para-aminobenzoate synthetase / 4-amino-4-deoxychorismate lyase
MVRNDLGRVAHTGSVHANPLFAVARYPLQWQMTSRVTAEVHDGTLSGLFEAMFPSGSVTGAPKHSAMHIIRSLESTPRGIYTGAIGYISPHGRSHFSVAIRTVVVDHRKAEAEFGVGSGVVWDSVDRDEYDECLIKASMLRAGPRFMRRELFRAVPAYVIGERPGFQLLETIAWTPEDGFALLDRHLERICASAVCFGFPCEALDLRTVLDAAVADLHKPARVRLLLESDGTVACEALDLVALPDGPLRAALAPTPIDRGNLFLYHKTTRREVYEAAKAGRPTADAVILWNGDGEVTEATDYNVVAEIDGAKVTPPIECGLLPGVMRAELLARGEIAERRILVDELRAASRVWLVNSVRGWVPCAVTR